MKWPADYNSANLSVTKPDNCFRIGANKINYLADYAIELAAKGSAVSWGSVDWEAHFGEEGDNPFMDMDMPLACDTVMVAAADEVDVCSLFEEEVDRALDAGWGGTRGANADVYFEGATSALVDAADAASADPNVANEDANTASSAELNFETESDGKKRAVFHDLVGPRR